MQHNVVETADQGIPPAEGLVERALNAIQTLSEARESHVEGAERFLNAYEVIREANAELSEELAEKEAQLGSVTERNARLEAEIERVKGLAREAVTAVKTAQDERDRAREDLRNSRDSYERLNSTHNQLIETNAKLSGAFEKLITEVGSGTRMIRDGSRRLSDVVVPTPARPRAPRAPATGETQIERMAREVGEVAAHSATARHSPRLATLDGQPQSDEILDPSDRREVDRIMDGFGRARA